MQLCYLRFPGIILAVDQPPFLPLLKLVTNQLKVGIESWNEYGQREQILRKHLVELQTVFGFRFAPRIRRVRFKSALTIVGSAPACALSTASPSW